VKPKLTAAKTATPAPGWFTQDGKPDPNGLFDKDGFQTRLSARAAPKIDLAKKKREDSEAAIKAGYKR
jgi:hypothetical protein